jgi:hypothetical protein
VAVVYGEQDQLAQSGGVGPIELKVAVSCLLFSDNLTGDVCDDIAYDIVGPLLI